MELGPSELFKHRVSKGLKEGVWIASVLLCLYTLLALVSYNASDPAWTQAVSHEHINNYTGVAGAWLADILFSFIGYVAFLLPLFLAYYAWSLLRKDKVELSEFHWGMLVIRLLGFSLLILSGAALTNLFVDDFMGLPFSSGGIIGDTLAQSSLSFFNLAGSVLILVAVFLFGLTAFADISWLKIVDTVGALTLKLMRALGVSSVGVVKNAVKHQQKTADSIKDKAKALVNVPALVDLSRNMQKKESHSESNAVVLEGEIEVREDVGKNKKRTKLKKVEPVITDVTAPDVESTSESKTKSKGRLFGQKTKMDVPSIDTLDKPKHAAGKGYSDSDLESMSRLLEEKLKDFGVVAEVVGVCPGPVITRFEIQPAPGVKASRITNLARDLARSLTVISVRVVEVIQGKSVVGIEIPNEHRKIVYLHEVLNQTGYKKASSRVTLALGHDISGQPIVADLAKMPHLLVAGTTGSGKSVGVNAMLLSLLLKSTPDEVRLLLIDPKMLELSVYDGIPHLLTPVVTDMKDAGNGLRWCVAEMERRYKLMAALGVRNISGYNRKVKEALKDGNPILDPLWSIEVGQEFGVEEPPALETLPFIVVVIDELADMMMIVGKKVEELIARIAQKARAAGIHLILATQRPSVDVLTGLIKANVPTRIAFQVSSKIDSRTIIDQGGAEQLLGHGDMLYLPPGTGMPVRVHGAFVDDDEVHRVVAEWKSRGEPCFVDEITSGVEASDMGAQANLFDSSEQGDALYDQAVAFVTESRKASISAVQRKLRIGYNRAARMIEAMESAGVVSEMSASGAREVLAPPPPPKS